MSSGFLRVRFVDEYDGTGELIAHAGSDGFSGTGRAYFNTEAIQKFADAIANFPVSNAVPLTVAGGFVDSAERSGIPEQEHLGISVYPIDSHGHIGIQIRMATPLYTGDRPESRKSATVELVTTHEPLARFSRDLLAMLGGNTDEAVFPRNE